MNNASLKPKNATILPYREYVDSLGKIRKSMLYAELRLVTEKGDTTLWRWRNGSIRPGKTERDAIAFSLSKHVKTKLTGDEIFPVDYSYKGRNAKAN